MTQTQETPSKAMAYIALAMVYLMIAVAAFGAESDCQPLDLSRATAEEIAAAVNGIGPVKAAAIIAVRPASPDIGNWNWETVDAVKGIGPVTLAELQRVAVLYYTDAELERWERDSGSDCGE